LLVDFIPARTAGDFAFHVQQGHKCLRERAIIFLRTIAPVIALLVRLILRATAVLDMLRHPPLTGLALFIAVHVLGIVSRLFGFQFG